MEMIKKIFAGLILATIFIAITWLQIKIAILLFPIIIIMIFLGVFAEIFSKK